MYNEKPLRHDNTALTHLTIVEKWCPICNGYEIDHGAWDCHFCKVYRVRHIGTPEEAMHVTCHGCPMKEATGEHGCAKGPYADWFNSFKPMAVKHVTTPDQAEKAEAVLEFLINLLPPEERKIYGA